MTPEPSPYMLPSKGWSFFDFSARRSPKIKPIKQRTMTHPLRLRAKTQAARIRCFLIQKFRPLKTSEFPSKIDSWEDDSVPHLCKMDDGFLWCDAKAENHSLDTRASLFRDFILKPSKSKMFPLKKCNLKRHFSNTRPRNFSRSSVRKETPEKRRLIFDWITSVSGQYKASSMLRIIPCHANELTFSHSSVSDVHLDGICIDRCSMKPAVHPGTNFTWMLCSFSGFLGPKSAAHMATARWKSHRAHLFEPPHSYKSSGWYGVFHMHDPPTSWPNLKHARD